MGKYSNTCTPGVAQYLALGTLDPITPDHVPHWHARSGVQFLMQRVLLRPEFLDFGDLCQLDTEHDHGARERQDLRGLEAAALDEPVQAERTQGHL